MDSKTETTFAPGCFGSALAFSQDDEVCKACPFHGDCETRSVTALASLQSMFGVASKPRRRKSEAMSQKAEEIFNALGQSADEIRKAVMSGRNPFSLRRGFLGDVVSVLLSHPNVTRAFLTQVLEARRAVRTSVADVYARQAIQILRHCDVITVAGDTIQLRQERDSALFSAAACK